jgi:O-methyltransferase domain
LDDFQWSRFTMVVDLAGGLGGFLSVLLKRQSQMHGTLVDLPDVITSAEQAWSTEHPALQPRISFQPSNLLETLTASVPAAHTHTAFVLRNVLHDWNDDACLKILINVRRAMAGCSHMRLLIIEMALMTGREATMTARRLSDVQMMVLQFGGKERSERDFQKLLATAGLQLLRVYPSRGLMWVLEVAAA